VGAVVPPPAVTILNAPQYLTGEVLAQAAARYITDKRPDNFLHIALIKRLFPDTRIVHTVRNALDTMLSVYFLYFDDSISYGHDLGDIAHWFGQYRRLMRHWRDLYPDSIHDLSYDALVEDPTGELAGVRVMTGDTEHSVVSLIEEAQKLSHTANLPNGVVPLASNNFISILDPEHQTAAEILERSPFKNIIAVHPAMSSSRASFVELEDGTRGIWKPDAEGAMEMGAVNAFVANPGSEVAAFLLDQRLGQNIVPTTIYREMNGKPGSLQIIVAHDNVDLGGHPHSLAFFDELTNNFDRHGGNYLTDQGVPVAIDNGLAFRVIKLDVPGEAPSNTVFKSSVLEIIKDVTLTDAEKQLKLQYLLPEKSVYENLVKTSVNEWRSLLAEHI
ncbi:MAG: hypothetical protein EOO38_26010, partial [Cytophagaceae bacterium]